MAFGDNWQCMSGWQMEVTRAESWCWMLSTDAVGKDHAGERTPPSPPWMLPVKSSPWARGGGDHKTAFPSFLPLPATLFY